MSSVPNIRTYTRWPQWQSLSLSLSLCLCGSASASPTWDDGDRTKWTCVVCRCGCCCSAGKLMSNFQYTCVRGPSVSTSQLISHLILSPSSAQSTCCAPLYRSGLCLFTNPLRLGSGGGHSRDRIRDKTELDLMFYYKGWWWRSAAPFL